MSRVSYRISKTIHAPLEYVYAWCTDFTDEDPEIIGAPYTRHVIEKTKKRAIWIHRYKMNGDTKEGVRIVTLSPPQSWHLESVNEELTRTGDYTLRSLGLGNTKLEIVIKTEFKTIKPESARKLKESLSEDWEKYKAALEKDYASARHGK